MKKTSIIIITILLLVTIGCQKQKPTTNNTNTKKQNINITTEAVNENVNTGVGDIVVEEIQEPTGKTDSALTVSNYNESKAQIGKTLFSDFHDPDNPRIVEVNMSGDIIWEYILPQNLKRFTNPGLDVELLENNNLLIELPRYGIIEIDREGSVVWEYKDTKTSHDVDVLKNGNLIVVFGNDDTREDAQVKEISRDGEVVWEYKFSKDFDTEEFRNTEDQGWTHINAIMELDNGNYILSPRNFNMLIEITNQGELVRKIGEEYLVAQHDPVMLDNGNILLSNHDEPHEVLEINPDTEEIVWRYPIQEKKQWPVRDSELLDNGNILITCSQRLLEVTRDNEIVWQLDTESLIDKSVRMANMSFFKAIRLDY